MSKRMFIILFFVFLVLSIYYVFKLVGSIVAVAVDPASGLLATLVIGVVAYGVFHVGRKIFRSS